MKRIILFLLFFYLFHNSAFSQLLGTGRSDDQYRGTVTEDIVWGPGNPHYPYPNNIVYVGSTVASERILTINNGYALTLSTGLTMQMTQTGSELRNNGSFLAEGGTIVNTRDIINNGTITIQPGTALTIRNITNNGTLRLNADAYGMASLIVRSSYSGTGTTETQLYLTGGASISGNRWHYVSTPVDQAPVSVFTANPANLDFAQYVESRVTGTDMLAGWVGWDGWLYSPWGEYDPGNAFNTLDLGKGYNYYNATNTTRTIVGAINISDVTVPLSRANYTHPDYQGWNLIGNPFSSCIDWEIVYNNGDIPPGMNNAVYFTLNGGFASYVNLVGTGGGTQFIPPAQGFFVKATQPGESLDLRGANDSYLDIRVHNVDQMRYKGLHENINRTSLVPLVRLKLENDTDSNDLVVRFDAKATLLFDKMFDAYKFSKTAGNLNIWTKTGNVDYSINGLPFPETKVEIPVGLNVKTPGTFRLLSNELNKLEDYSVTLRDLVTNHIVDLKKGESILFNTPAGLIEDRFVLTVANLTTGIPEIPVGEKKFSVYSSSGIINILSLTDEFGNTRGSVTIFDLTGRKIYQDDNTEWQGSGDLKQITMNSGAKGLIFVEIKAGQRRYIEKVILH